ncbi:hypothetical protein F4859DRAFT_386762 [Xylaria cf. heliscus]|nr:hypothetical protein F4859DRAFT_386762 [Xylaria cf. heliscus]
MHSKALLTTTLAAAAATATAIPTSRTTGSSKGFNLRAHLTSPTRDLSPSIQNLYLSDLRTGAGTAITTLTTSAPNPPFYLNGTAYHTTITHDIPSVYPLSLIIAGPDTSDFLYPGEHAITTAINGGTELFLRAGEPILFPVRGDEGGQYAVCYRDIILGGGETRILTARYVYGNESVPDDCAPVEFVVECATLEDLPEGAAWNHDSVFEVPCVKN